MEKILAELKSYGPWGVAILAACVSAAISYGSNSAFQSSDHEMVAKDHDILLKLVQHVDDLWHDAGHREKDTY